MRLSDFILAHFELAYIEPILAEREAFAGSLLPGAAASPMSSRASTMAWMIADLLVGPR